MWRDSEGLAAVPGLLMAVFLAVAAACLGTVDGAADTGPSEPAVAAGGLSVGRPAGWLPGETGRIWIPANALVVLQSLDLTGQRHGYRLRAVSAEEGLAGGPTLSGRVTGAGSVCVARLVLSEAERFGGLLPRDAEFVRSAAAGRSRCFGLDAGVAGESLGRAEPVGDAVARRFLLPCFTETGVREVVEECECVSRGEAAAVYVCGSEEAMVGVEQLREIGEFLSVELGRSGGTLRAAVESQLGEIADVDGDGVLTVVLARLDCRDEGLLRGEVPVLGCVRESDFLSLGVGDGIGGDILYLDPRGLVGSWGRSLLSHELSHAAVHSRQRSRLERGAGVLELPGWFHEALAQRVEHCVAGPGAGYAVRLESFIRQPQLSAVVQPAWSGWSTGRGGSRAAGVLFLERSLRKGVCPAELLEECGSFEELLCGLLERPFVDSLREWGPAGAIAIADVRGADISELSATGEWSSGVLQGTGFAIWRSGCSGLELELDVAADAAVQLTVISGGE